MSTCESELSRSGPRLRGGKRRHGPGDGSLLRDPINKEKISLKKGNAAVSKEELNPLVALHSTATRQKDISLCDAVWEVRLLSFSLRIQHCLFHFSHIYLPLDNYISLSSPQHLPFLPLHSLCHEDSQALVRFPLQSLW